MEENTGRLRKRYILFIILIPIFTFAFGWVTGYQQGPGGTRTNIEIPEKIENDSSEPFSLDLYWNIYNIISQKFLTLDEVSSEKLLYGTIKGLVSGLNDPYSQFMTPEEHKEFEDSLAGHLEGIGAELAKDGDKLVIITPLRKSPAENAGIEPGDVILAIDGDSSAGISLTDAVRKIRGKAGTKVKLTIQRSEPFEVKDMEITRGSISIPSIEADKLDEKVEVIKIVQFGEKTYKEFQKTLSSALLSKPELIVLDMRNNGGGILDEAIKIVSEFVTNKTVTEIETRISDSSRETKTIKEKTVGGGSAVGIPVVVWINRGSASASEIVAGFFKETGRGYVIGEKSFGKGSVQELISLQNGSSLRLTTAKWLTPSGNSIDKEGVMPDLLIEDLFSKTREERDSLFKEKTLEYLKTLD